MQRMFKLSSIAALAFVSSFALATQPDRDMDNSRNNQSYEMDSSSSANGNRADIGVSTQVGQTTLSNLSGGNVNGTITGGSDDAVSNSMGNRTDIGDLSARSGDVRGGDQSITGGDQTVTGGNQSLRGGDQSVTGGDQTVRGGDQSLRGGDQTTIQGQAQNAQTQSGVSKSGNSQTSVDASNRSTNTYTSRTTVWAPVVHGPAAAPLAAANLVVVPGKCGPRVNIVKTDVNGKRFGVWGGQDDVLQGSNYDMESAKDSDGKDEPFKRVGDYLLGHEVTIQSAVVGTSSGGSFSLGGFGKNGEGAQGGGAASGGLQQIVSKILVRDCIMAVEKMSEAVAAQ